jgi:hypothetical protein
MSWSKSETKGCARRGFCLTHSAGVRFVVPLEKQPSFNLRLGLRSASFSGLVYICTFPLNEGFSEPVFNPVSVIAFERKKSLKPPGKSAVRNI